MNICHNIDCMEHMKTCKDNHYDLAIVDPPYGIGIKGVNPMKNKNDVKNFNTEWDKMPTKKYFIEILRISRNTIIWGGNYFLDYLGYCKAPIIWDKLNGESLYADGEMAWTAGPDITRNLKIFRHKWCGAFRDSERRQKAIHPTQKPIALYKWLLTNYAKPGQTIFDSHVGSGSIRIACHDLGFDFEGCELDEDYWKAQEERYKNHIAQGELFEKEEIQKLIYKES